MATNRVRSHDALTTEHSSQSSRACRQQLFRSAVLVVAIGVFALVAAQPVSAGTAGTVHPAQSTKLTATPASAGPSSSSSLLGIANLWELGYCATAAAFPIFFAVRYHDCWLAGYLAAWALLGADFVFPDDLQRRDAYRHCIWAAWLTIRLGEDRGNVFLHNHERGDAPIEDKLMDYGNNAIGQGIGQDITNRARAGDDWDTQYFRASGECYDRAVNGDLWIIEGEYQPYLHIDPELHGRYA